MKKLIYYSRIFVFFLFCISVIATLLQYTGKKNPLSVFDEKIAEQKRDELFDPSLFKLNSVDKVITYSDSVYHSRFGSTPNPNFEREYTQIVGNVIRNRFFHGYSYYSFENNYLAVLFSKITKEGYSAVVIPDDILKYPNAACSQQSIVMMEVLKKRGFETRKIGFSGKTTGHFCLEVYYDGSWHFYDTNMEPDEKLLNQYNRPSVAYLSANKNLLKQAYAKYTDFDIIDLFSNYTYGPVNKFPAPRGVFFQKTAKFLSFTLWLFLFILFILIHRYYIRYLTTSHVRNSRISFPQTQQNPPADYNRGVTAPGA